MLQDPNQPQNNQMSNPANPQAGQPGTPNQQQPGQNAQTNQPGSADPRLRQNRGTGFTNISTILNANQGAGQRMGDAIGSGINKQADSVRQGIQQGQASFNNSMQSNVQNANNNIQAGKNLSQQAGETNDAYASRLANANGIDYSKIGQNLQNTAYNGPTALDNAGQLQSQSATASALGRLAGNSSGQSQLLQNMVAQRGNYGTGQNALDSLLIGRQGQGAIQQGRSAVNGLTQQVNDVTSSAAAQANAAKQAIDTNRVNTLQTLQNQLSGTGDASSNNITGLMQQAKNQATQFGTEATRLQQLLEGNIAAKDITDSDKALMANMGNYGVNDYNLYLKDPSQVDQLLKQYAANMTTNFGAYKYSDDQQKAAQNLSDVLGQSDVKQQIANNKFNNNVFSGDAKAIFNPLDTQRDFDTQTKQILQNAYTGVKGLDDAQDAKNKEALQNYLGQVSNSDDYKKMNADQQKAVNDYIQRGYDSAHSAIYNGAVVTNPYMSGSPFSPDFSQYANATPETASLLQKLGITPSYNGDVSVNVNPDAANLANQYSGYGWLLYGDRSGDLSGVDPRFAGLGLNAQHQESGRLRTADAFQSAAEKALAQSQDLKQYVLNKYLQNQTQVDPSSSDPTTLKQV